MAFDKHPFECAVFDSPLPLSLAVCVGVAAINLALDSGDADKLQQCLANPDVGLHSVAPDCTPTYYNKLASFKERKATSGE